MYFLITKLVVVSKSNIYGFSGFNEILMMFNLILENRNITKFFYIEG